MVSPNLNSGNCLPVANASSATLIKSIFWWLNVVCRPTQHALQLFCMAAVTPKSGAKVLTFPPSSKFSACYLSHSPLFLSFCGWEVGSEECEIWSVKCVMWSLKCAVWNEKCAVWSLKCAVYGMRNVKCEVRNVQCMEWGMWSVKFEMCSVWNEECEVWSLKCAVWKEECEVWSLKCAMGKV